jgi:hypothetical protein
MSPFLVFLNAARNLASMGMKREQVLDFAKNEFGELTDLMKSQIDNIYRPKKSVSPKDPDFDDTVVKMKFDDEGKPFNPRDPLKDYSKKDKKADGGRIGLRIGSGEGKDVSGREYDAPSAAARSVSTSPSRDRDDGPSNNFTDTRTKKKIIEGVKKGAGTATRNFITNQVFDKFGKALKINPKAAAILGIIGAIRGSTKKSLPGDLSMLDEEGIGSLPESNLFADVSAKDLKRKGMIEGAGFDYGDAQMMNMINPTMTQEEFEGMMKGTITEPTGKFAAADGGRIGFDIGSFPMKKDGFFVSPDFDKMTPEQKRLYENNIKLYKKIQESMMEKLPKPSEENKIDLKKLYELRKKQAEEMGLPSTIQLLESGGRVGLKDGVTKDGILFPTKRDGFSVSPDFDNMTEEQKMYIEGMKIQEKMRQKKLKEILDKIKDSMPENERNIKPVPMPKRDLPMKGILQSLAGGGRVGFKKGLLASMMEGLSPDGGIFQSIFANRKHPILSTLNATELLSLGEALRPVIGFNEGGRVGLKSGTGIFKGLKKFLMPGADDKLERQLLGTELGYEGLNNLMQLLQGSGLFASGGRVGLKDGPQDPKRRSILKMIGGGLMSLPILSKLKFLAPLAPTIKKAAERGIDVAPTYFFDLVNKIKMFGKQGKGAEDRVTEYNYKNYSLEENVSDGTQRITIKKGDPEVSYKEEIMEYTPPKMEEDIGQLPAQYDEVTVRPDMDGKMKDIEDGIDDISEILEEVKKSAPPIKKAAGGLAYMLGE